VSRRYVDNEPEFYIPEVWRKRAENVKQGSGEQQIEMNCWAVGAAESLSENCLSYYQALLSEGVCPEQARMVLPQNTMTEWIWTGSLYGWFRVCKLRLDSHTQKETREVAQMINDKMKDIFPVSWEALMEI
jgi:thymidylate synthase (FAD)